MSCRIDLKPKPAKRPSDPQELLRQANLAATPPEYADKPPTGRTSWPQRICKETSRAMRYRRKEWKRAVTTLGNV